ncbi:esterase-like activity of phytase family protein [Compostimonas suwonensis]|uniref:LPXTG-motif cell wall-anchored protein n=1 Tax=Compostimonas suwonensis TaxID=1048394 RepID=A0A2M9BU50_9MICO|nr:esterase-like activity of phytase family protein [Compostimonas suwonensis]PJJ61474.1 LPXTG-motif cell wall-anchored protein [Compostimonas suwonensis]
MGVSSSVRGGAVVAASVAAIMVTGAVALPAANAAEEGQSYFNRVATVPAYLNATPVGGPAVAEISTVTPDGNTVITTDAVGDQIAFYDITDAHAPVAAGAVPVDGSPTSVYAVGDYILAVVDGSDGDFVNPSGHVSVLAADGDHEVLETIELGGQPDSIDMTSDGKYAVIAMENQRDEEFTPEGKEEGDLPQLPSGELVILTLDGAPADWELRRVALAGLSGLTEAEDAETEYVTISPDDSTVAVTLQENNGVAFVDIESAAVTSHFSAGTSSLSGIDTEDDGALSLTGSFTDVPREPDSIGWIGNDLVATANEGDWLGGTRGWTIFDAQTGDVVFDSGTDMEYLAIQHALYPDSRSDAKGTEPEGLLSATFDGVPYVFVGSERGNFVAVYDVTDPTQPRFVQILPSTNGPEGLLAIPERDLLVVSSEEDDAEISMRATVQVYEFGADKPFFPSLRSEYVDEKPIAWGAQSGLTADPNDPGILYSVSDNAYAPSLIYTIDVTEEPAVITEARPVTVDGENAALDLEGIFARPAGGYWAVSEGATGPENHLLLLDDAAAVIDDIELPATVADALGKWGFEGVSAQVVGENEYVWTALQRELSTDPAGTVRLARYDVEAGSWDFFGYELDAVSDASNTADWMGLSEITVFAGKLAVIERDKLNGEKAAIKRIYSVELPTGPGLSADDADGELPVLEKTLRHDVLPDMKATHGWTQEKLEGFTVGTDGQAYAVTDNDGVNDATGETVFLRLGSADVMFGLVPDDGGDGGTGEGTDPAGEVEKLPSTGADAMLWLAAGGILLAGGIATTFLVRRRRLS